MNFALIEELRLDTGFEIEDDDLRRTDKDPQWLRDLQKAYDIGISADYNQLWRIKNFIKKYPDSPEFRNYEWAVYLSKDKKERCHQISQEMMRDFPDYFFSKTMFGQRLIDQERYEEFKDLFGDNLDHPPSFGPLHFTEARAYLLLLVQYYLGIDDREKVEYTFRRCLDIGDGFTTAGAAAKRISGHRMISAPMVIAQSVQKRQVPQSLVTSDFEGYELGEFNYTLLDNLGSTFLNDVTVDLIKNLEGLDRELLRQDVTNLVLRAVKNYIPDEADDTLIHAVYIIGAFKFDDLFDLVIRILKQGDERLDSWFGGCEEEFIFPTLFEIGKERVADYMDFLMAPNISCQPKSVVLYCMIQQALYFPDSREEVLCSLDKLMMHFIDHCEDEDLFDTDFITDLIYELVKLRATEFEGLITECYSREWVSVMAIGELETILSELTLPLDPANIDPFPKNLSEYYYGNYHDRRAASNKEPFWKDTSFKTNDLILSLSLREPGPPEEVFDFSEEEFDFIEDNNPYVRPHAKVGRNDPCPCGSDKKFKKCCLGKELA